MIYYGKMQEKSVSHLLFPQEYILSRLEFLDISVEQNEICID